MNGVDTKRPDGAAAPALPVILLVDDDADTIRLLARILAGIGHLRFATSGDDALRLARESPPDLVLLDSEMPGLDGFSVCAALRRDDELADVPVVFVTSHAEPSFEIAGFEAGASDFIAKPVSAPLVVARVRAQLRVKALADALRRVSTLDALTGLANRRRFDEALRREWLRAQRDGTPLSLLLVDVDHFKDYNDHYGHLAGDACLRAVAGALQDASQRPGDLVARFGGEEFALLLPGTPRSGAEHLARVLVGTVAAQGIPHARSSCAPTVSVSVGAAAIVPSADDAGHADKLVEAADAALYAAKRGGRARIGVAPALEPS